MLGHLGSGADVTGVFWPVDEKLRCCSLVSNFRVKLPLVQVRRLGGDIRARDKVLEKSIRLRDLVTSPPGLSSGPGP